MKKYLLVFALICFLPALFGCEDEIITKVYDYELNIKGEVEVDACGGQVVYWSETKDDKGEAFGIDIPANLDGHMRSVSPDLEYEYYDCDWYKGTYDRKAKKMIIDVYPNEGDVSRTILFSVYPESKRMSGVFYEYASIYINQKAKN